MTLPYYDAEAVEKLLDYPGCIAAMREAMAALSAAGRAQPLRQIMALGEGRLFGVMPGELDALGSFGAKLVSVFSDPTRPGRSRHRGVVAAFDGRSGELACLADAETVTHIRTGCATAVATDVLARTDATTLGIFGTGAQADSHIRAIRHVRPLTDVLLWGRSLARATELAERLSHELALPVRAASDPREVAGAAILCTVSSSAEPVLLREWVRPGTHVNLVGSSFLGPVEVDSALVQAARYIADYRPGVLAQASELAVAREASLVDDSHVVGEIGEVLLGRLPGRETADQITLYKSLGHVVQDLAAAARLHRRATEAAE